MIRTTFTVSAAATAMALSLWTPGVAAQNSAGAITDADTDGNAPAAKSQAIATVTITAEHRKENLQKPRSR